MWRAGFKWMFLIIGTTIGAGYASGRELWQFFGHESGLAILLFTIMFIICCNVVLRIAHERKTADYVPLLQVIVGRRLTRIYDVMIFVYLFTITVVMIAGSGVTAQAFNLSYWWGVAILVVILVLVFAKGVNGIVTINYLILPLLIGGLMFLLLSFIVEQNVFLLQDWQKQDNWLSAFPFTALNILPLIAVLGAIGNKVKTRGEIAIASIGSGLIMGTMSFLYNSSLIEIADEVLIYEMPLFAILQRYPIGFYIFMTFMLWFAIFTTAASGVLGLVTRVRSRIPLKMWILALLFLIIMVPLTLFGFSNLVNFTYPIYGFLNLYILVRLIFYPLWKNDTIDK